MISPRFHRCPPDPDCPYCAAAAALPADERFDWSFLDGVYCISLQSRDDRANTVAREFHRVGLCQRVLFYRPIKHPSSPKKGVWESHQAVARHARAQGHKTVLICEDDVVFQHRLQPRTVAAVNTALRRLPAHWMGFYLGHWPWRAYFVNRRTLLTSSFCTHAYIASDRLLKWLCATPCSKAVAKVALGGGGLDAAFAALPAMYAFFPMIALQSGSPGDHLGSSQVRRKLSDYLLNTRFRDILLARLMRPSEWLVVALSPLFRGLAAARRSREQ